MDTEILHSSLLGMIIGILVFVLFTEINISNKTNEILKNQEFLAKNQATICKIIIEIEKKKENIASTCISFEEE